MIRRNKYGLFGSDGVGWSRLTDCVKTFFWNGDALEKVCLSLSRGPYLFLLEQAVLKQEDEEIERQAHALKGVAANLGFDQLSQHANQIVQLVRQRPEGYRDMIKQEWEQLKAVYQKVLDAINCCKQ